MSVGGLFTSASATPNNLLGSSYYVSKTGSDSNACTFSVPCKTIKRGLSVTQSGDTLTVLSGVYNEYVSITKSITLISVNATIDGTGATGSVTDGLVSVTASNVKVQNFTIINAKMYGLANFGSNNQFTGNTIHNTQNAGIWMRNGKYNTFSDNQIYNTVLQNSVSYDGTRYICSPTNTAWASSINSWGTASNNTWSNNNVHDNCGEGIVATTGDIVTNNTFKDNWSVEIYLIGSGISVTGNTTISTRPYTTRGSNQAWRNVPYSVSIGDETTCLADNNIIANNTLNNGRAGLSFYQYVSCSGVRNTTIENNSINNAWEYGIRILSGNHSNSFIRNNKIQLNNGRPLIIQSGAGFTITNNTFYSNVNIFEWNGSNYNFTTWNNLVGNSNVWSNLSQATPTPAVSTSTKTLTPVSPTFTRTPSPTVTKTGTPTFTPTIPVTVATISETPTPSQTPSLVYTDTFTPFPYETPTIPSGLCAKIVYGTSVSLIALPSEFSYAYDIFISPNVIVPVEYIISNDEGTWAQINDRLYFPLYITSLDVTYAIPYQCQ